MGLYDDDNTAVTAGDLPTTEYWQTRFEFTKLENALNTRQPEGAIKTLVPGIISAADELLKKYPNHQDIKQWKEKAQAIQQKIDPNASATSFTADLGPWNNHSFEQGWRSYGLAGTAAQTNDWGTVHTFASEAVRQFERCAGLMSNWSPEAQEWINKALDEMRKLDEEAMKRK